MTLLKVLIRQNDWSASQNNIAACVVTVVYCKIALEGIAFLRLRFGMTAAANYSKQLVYMLLSTCILFWPLYDTNDWSWRLNAVVPTAMLVRFLYKVLYHTVLYMACSLVASLSIYTYVPSLTHSHQRLVLHSVRAQLTKIHKTLKYKPCPVRHRHRNSCLVRYSL
jgi:accessory gene regulator protein AgrB